MHKVDPDALSRGLIKRPDERTAEEADAVVRNAQENLERYQGRAMAGWCMLTAAILISFLAGMLTGDYAHLELTDSRVVNSLFSFANMGLLIGGAWLGITSAQAAEVHSDELKKSARPIHAPTPPRQDATH